VFNINIAHAAYRYRTCNNNCIGLQSGENSCKMAFGTELQGRSSHEALLGLQDCELRQLDGIKKCVTQRIKCDRDYANSLEGFIATANKIGVLEYMTPVCLVSYCIYK